MTYCAILSNEKQWKIGVCLLFCTLVHLDLIISLKYMLRCRKALASSVNNTLRKEKSQILPVLILQNHNFAHCKSHQCCPQNWSVCALWKQNKRTCAILINRPKSYSRLTNFIRSKISTFLYPVVWLHADENDIQLQYTENNNQGASSLCISSSSKTTAWIMS